MFQPLTTYTGDRRVGDHERAERDTPGGRRHYYAELLVEHSPEAVWEFFVDFNSWTTWSPVCRGCRLSDERGKLQLGGVLEISSAVFGITFTAAATIVEFEPPTRITWRAEKWGIRSSHSYRFLPRAGGTLLCNEEIFSGVWFPFSALMGPWYRATDFSRRSLEGMKRELARRTNGRVGAVARP